MEVYEVLKLFRKQLGFAQKEILTDLDPSVYSRIENGKQELKITDLKKIMNTLSLLPEEVFTLAPLDLEQRIFKKLYSYCAQNIQDKAAKQDLVNYYIELSSKNKNLRELSNYFAIKSYFSQLWDEIDGVSQEELEHIYFLLSNKKYYQHYDYIIIRNAMKFFEKEKADALIQRIFLPETKPKTVINDSFYYILLNAITSRVYEKEYTLARKYIYLAKKNDKEGKDFHYQTHLKYLENLLDYITIGDYQYIQRIHEYIHLLKDIGDTILAGQISIDVKLVLDNEKRHIDKNDFPVILIKK